MSGRPQSEEAQAILGALARVEGPAPAGLTAQDVARRLQLSRRAATVHLSRMAERGQVQVVAVRAVEGCARPAYVYRQVVVDLYPAGTLFASLHRAIAARRAIRERG